MTIKEAENRLGITSANIRFYEREKLISPRRNDENNYRDYSEVDIERLKKIKLLRIIGISVPHIRKLIEGGVSLDDVIEEQKENLQKEEKHIRELQLICQEILAKKMEFENLDCSLMDEKSKDVKSRLEEILNEDTSAEDITAKQFNRYIWKCLTAAFLSDTVLCLVLSAIIRAADKQVPYPEYLDYLMLKAFQPMAVILVIAAVITAFSTVWTAKLRPLCMNFAAAVLLLPIFMMVACFLLFHTIIGASLQAAVFFGEITVFVFIMGFLSERYHKLMNHCLWGIFVGAAYSGIMTAVNFYLQKNWAFWSVCTLVMVIYISINWIMENRLRTSYNKYVGIITAIGIVNIAAKILSGSGNAKSWRRDGREFK